MVTLVVNQAESLTVGVSGCHNSSRSEADLGLRGFCCLAAGQSGGPAGALDHRCRVTGRFPMGFELGVLPPWTKPHMSD